MTLTEKLEAAVKRFDMLPRPAMKVVVGVSGGADSIGLACALTELERYAPEIFVCHFNHLLRGDRSQRDADFVAEFCEKKRLPLEVRSLDTADFSRRKGVSVELGARMLRYDFFGEVRQKIGARRIAVAHTSDDRAETVIMRIARGSGSRGISSIKPRSGNLIRPFLGISSEEIVAYLKKIGQKWVEDESNELTVFTRNRVRKQVMPLLETFNPRIRDSLNRLADVAGMHSSYITLRAREHFGRVFFHTSPGMLAGGVRAFCSLHPALRAEILRVAYAKAAGGFKPLGFSQVQVSSEENYPASGGYECPEFSHIRAMDEILMSGKSSSSVNLPSGLVMEKGYGIFLFRRSDERCDGYSLTAEKEGALEIPGGTAAHFEISSNFSSPPRDLLAGCFSLEKTGFPIEVRNFRPGDRIVPLGMSGTRKLKSVFIDRKIPLFLRSRLPIFVRKNKIIWAGGVVISDLYKAVKGKRFLKIRLEGHAPEIARRCRENCAL